MFQGSKSSSDLEQSQNLARVETNPLEEIRTEVTDVGSSESPSVTSTSGPVLFAGPSSGSTARLSVDLAVTSSANQPLNQFVSALRGDLPTICAPELSQFLRLVAQGEQATAEKMLQKNRGLVLFPGNVTDLSKRSFEGITGFQYAVWALDWHMWTMLQQYFPNPQTALEQLNVRGSWVETHGLHAGVDGGPLEQLMKAYDSYNGQYDYFVAHQDKQGQKRLEDSWCKTIGGAQRMVPAHVWHEYCHSTRAFVPVPDFEDATELPRTREIHFDYNPCQDFLNTALTGQYGTLGHNFALYRGAWFYRHGCDQDGMSLGYWHIIQREEVSREKDQYAITALWKTRMQQREQLIAELSNRHTATEVPRMHVTTLR